MSDKESEIQMFIDYWTMLADEQAEKDKHNPFLKQCYWGDTYAERRMHQFYTTHGNGD